VTDLVRRFPALCSPLPTRAVLLSALLLLASCSGFKWHEPASTATPAAKTAAVKAEQTALLSATGGAERNDNGISRKGRVLQLGKLVEEGPKGQPPQNNVVTLNYEQEDLRTVIEQLGYALGINMVIDPTIDYKVSLRTAANNPLRYQDIWPLLRLLARNAGVTVEQAGNVWKFTRNASNIPVEIVQPATLKQATSPEVLQVTPLTYISVDSIEKILTPLLQPAGSLIHMGAGNLLGIQGTPEQLARVNALLSVIDDDPFQNQGIQLYQLQNSPAAKVAEELTSVLKLIEGAQSSYQVLGLERINSVLVIAPASRGFDEVNRWVNILDAQSQEQVEQLFVYKVKNLDSKKMAETLNTVFAAKKDQTGTGRTQTRDQVRPLQQLQQLLPNQPQPTPQPETVPGGNTNPATIETITSANISVNLVADEDTNTILVRATPREYRQLLVTINSLDSVPMQVLINAVIGQVTLTDSNKFGIDWTRVSTNAARTTNATILPLQATTTTTTAGVATVATVPRTGLVLTRSFMDGAAVINATLNAIAEDNAVRLLARPTLLAANKQEGDIKVGSSVPVNNGSTQGATGLVTSNITYKDVGIELKITPQINDGGYINLKIEQTLSSVLDSGNAATGNNPTFANQNIKTTVVVADQSTITLGGLIQEDKSDQKSGIPVLMNIPLIGRAFAYNQLSNSRKELFVILRPQIVFGDQRDSETMKAMRDKFSEVSKMLEQVGF
jgi:general secretion pathway protein D